MIDSKRFKRGQVWYWEDPIFGKPGKKEIPSGEYTQRYNRYVIIVQSNDTIDKDSVIVVPITTTNHTSGNVKVHISQLFKDNFAYAKVTKIFPVSVKTLTEYICEISDDAMNRIEREIIRFLLPKFNNFLSSYTSDEDYDYDSSMIKSNINILYQNLQQFFDSYVSKNDSSNYSIKRVKEKFDNYLNSNDIYIEYKLSDFIHLLYKVIKDGEFYIAEKDLASLNIAKASNNMLLNIIIGGFTINDTPTFSSTSSEDNIPNEYIKETHNTSKISDDKIDKIIKLRKEGMSLSKIANTVGVSYSTVYRYTSNKGYKENNTILKKKGSKAKSDEEKIEFIKFYDAYGYEKASKKYNISMKTAQNYRYLYKKQLANRKEEGTESLDPESFTVDDIIKIGSSISNYSNIVVDELIFDNLYNKCIREGRSKYTNSSEFYKSLNCDIFNIIASKLNINRSSSSNMEFTCSEFNIFYKDSYNFFYRIKDIHRRSEYHQASKIKNEYHQASKIKNEYHQASKIKNWYDGEYHSGINDSIMSLLEKRIYNTYNINFDPKIIIDSLKEKIPFNK